VRELRALLHLLEIQPAHGRSPLFAGKRVKTAGSWPATI
jgi:hypothetical protein